MEWTPWLHVLKMNTGIYKQSKQQKNKIVYVNCLYTLTRNITLKNMLAI